MKSEIAPANKKILAVIVTRYSNDESQLDMRYQVTGIEIIRHNATNIIYSFERR